MTRDDDLPDVPRSNRSWSFEAASQILPDVRRLTARARERYEPLHEARGAHGPASAERSEVEQAMRLCLARWMREMEALGVRVTGIWRVEFETEEGVFPWSWPEESLRRFRGDDEDESTSIH